MRNATISMAVLAAAITAASAASAQSQRLNGGYAQRPANADIFRGRETYSAQQRRDGFFSQPRGGDGIIRWNTPHANGGLGNANGGGGGGSP